VADSSNRKGVARRVKIAPAFVRRLCWPRGRGATPHGGRR
jgi:hypothetical protein